MEGLNHQDFNKPQKIGNILSNNHIEEENTPLELPENIKQQINTLFRKSRMISISDINLNLNRNIVESWNDKQVIDFCSKSENLEELRKKPELLIALYERLNN